MRAAGLHPGAQTEVKRVLRELLRRGQVAKEGKRFFLPGGGKMPKAPPSTARLPSGGKRVDGVLHVHPDGFGFVHPMAGEEENVFVPREQAARALDGDRVLVEVVKGTGGRSAGRLVKVVERRRQLVVGTYRERRAQAFVEPHDESLGVVRVPATQLARDGDVVKVRLGVGGGLLGPGHGLIGEVAGSLGKESDTSVEVLSIAYARGFHEEFPPEVMDEADDVPISVSPEESKEHGRRDLRSLPLLTIDGEDARDFDDAIYVEDVPEGWRLVVAIADVSHYVKEGNALNAEALRRATSVYLPGRVLPMLPERLSAGICSLKPEEDRLCMVADLRIDRQGKLRRYELYPGVMRSAARCTYTEVHRVLAGEDVPHRNAFRPYFTRALALTRVLRKMREERGAIDFDLPETRIELDEEGNPARMVRRDRLESHRLVEECMLAANEAVARFFHEHHLPSVYRFHGEPDEDKLATFATLAAAHGFHLPKGKIGSKDLNLLLEKLEGHPERRALNQLLLRSMMQAVYSAYEKGHYGLGAEHYLHFTSPIRRYPDLLVHRMLKAHWARRGHRRPEHEVDTETERLEAMAVESSERERAAMQVEREVVSFYAALLMKERVGEEFSATISSLTDFGFFVELDGLFIEGLVKGESVEPRFRFDVPRHVMVFGSGRVVKVGQSLEVRLSSVNLKRRQLDFTVVAFAGEGPRAPARRIEHKEHEREERRTSPHPGFDRLRSEAAQRKGGKPSHRPGNKSSGGSFKGGRRSSKGRRR